MIKMRIFHANLINHFFHINFFADELIFLLFYYYFFDIYIVIIKESILLLVVMSSERVYIYPQVFSKLPSLKIFFALLYIHSPSIEPEYLCYLQQEIGMVDSKMLVILNCILLGSTYFWFFYGRRLWLKTILMELKSPLVVSKLNTSSFLSIMRWITKFNYKNMDLWKAVIALGDNLKEITKGQN